MFDPEVGMDSLSRIQGPDQRANVLFRPTGDLPGDLLDPHHLT